MVAAWATTLLADDRIGDLFVYSQMAELVRDGHVPYRDFAFEYPPLALPAIVALGGSEAGWSVMALVALLALQLVAPDRRSAWLMVLVPLLAGALVRTKYDLLPAVLAVAGVTALLRDRPDRAGVLLGAGALVKLWPGLLLLLRPSARSLYAGAATVAVVCLPFVLLGGFPGAMVDFHLDRPVQLESTPASVLLAIADPVVTGTPQRPDPFKSNGVDGGPDGLVRALFALAQLGAVAAIAVLAARRRDADGVVLGALGLVLAFAALGAVLSPQYLLWLLPLAALVAARGHLLPAALVAAAAIVTRLWFPGHYFDLVALDEAAVALVAIRNALLLAALAATARALARWPRRGEAARPW